MIEYIDRNKAIHAIKEHCEDTLERLSPGFPIELRNAYIMAHQHCMEVLSLLPASIEERKHKGQKHGRLIDADALITELLKEDGKIHRYCYPCKEVLKAVKDSPTIKETEL